MVLRRNTQTMSAQSFVTI